MGCRARHPSILELDRKFERGLNVPYIDIKVNNIANMMGLQM